MIAPLPDAAAARSLARLRPAIAEDAHRLLERGDAVGFLARLDLWFADVHVPISSLYGEQCDGLVEGLVRTALQATRARPADLRDVDRRREIDPRWYQHQRMVGYVAYTDRFAGTLEKLPGRLDHLAELGVTYLHLMPLLKPRAGANDGGYAVADYRAVDPRVGTMDDLAQLAAELRARGMSLCVDLVLNHTAREHPWARAWLAGDPDYAGLLHVYPDRTMPDAYEATVNDVFPDQAPGSFTWVPEADAWVWTTFFAYQWDLNYANPRVFAAMLETILWLANRGIEIFRLDAVPFMGKRLGTTCMNQPEVHDIVQALHALVKLAAPAVVFKAEAIVAPDELVRLPGRARPLPPRVRAGLPQPAHGDAVVEPRDEGRAARRPVAAPAAPHPGRDLLGHLRPLPRRHRVGRRRRRRRAVGYDPFAHRDFLNAFYSGRYPMSFARGALFGENPRYRRRPHLRLGRGAVRHQRSPRARRRARSGRGNPAARAAARRDLRLGRGAAALHGRRAGPGQRHHLPRRPRARGRQPLDAPALVRRRRRRPPPRPRHRRGPGLRLVPCAGATRAGQPALHAAGESAVLDDGLAHVLAWRRRHPAAATSSGWPTSRTGPRPCDVAHAWTGSASWTPCSPPTARPPSRRAAAAARAVVRLAGRGLVDSSPRLEPRNPDAARPTTSPIPSRRRLARRSPPRAAEAGSALLLGRQPLRITLCSRERPGTSSAPTWPSSCWTRCGSARVFSLDCSSTVPAPVKSNCRSSPDCMPTSMPIAPPRKPVIQPAS